MMDVKPEKEEIKNVNVNKEIKRSIHMTTDSCKVLAQSEDGVKPLSNPMGTSLKVKGDVNRGLYPREKRQTCKNKPQCEGDSDIFDSDSMDLSSQTEHESGIPTSDPIYISDDNSSRSSQEGVKEISSFKTMSGFTTASDVHKSTTSSAFFNPPDLKPITYGKRKFEISQNQKSITSFFTSPHKDSKRSKLDSVSSPDSGRSQYRSPSKMYSPIKKLENYSSIYISDDSISPKSTSQESLKEMSSSKTNVIKQLFDGQKRYDKMMSNDKKKSKGVKTKGSFSSSMKKQNSKTPTLPSLTVLKHQEDLNSEDDDVILTAEEEGSKNFGLLGACTNTEKKPEIDHSSTAPTEILEKIFCQLPILDLCLTCNRVCKRWNKIISNEKFLKSKKLYYKLKKSIGSAKSQVQKIMWENSMKLPSTFLSGLIRYSSLCHTLPKSMTDNITECLKKHKKYSWAEALIRERLPDLIIQKIANPWSIIATLVVISENVADIQEIIWCLTIPECQCTTVELLETLYNIATLLFAFKTYAAQDVFNGMHYRLFYAVYLFENQSSASYGDLAGALDNKGGQQSIVKYSKADASVRMTHEQLRIVNHKCQPGEVIKIVAFAGTGKTTTLVSYTQLRPSMKFLLVVYNKSVKEHAQTKFPRNVECKTGHGLAFGFTGRRYMGAGKMKFDLKVYTVSQLLPPRKGDNLFIRSKFVLDTLNNYLASNRDMPNADDVPNEQMGNDGNRVAVDFTKKDLYVQDAMYLWGRMKDMNDKSVPMTHDGYLKLYQLSKPKLKKYDCILIDEAQDLTPAITDILLNQTQTKILVGDPHQQIYSFRGAVNAMAMIQASQIFYLTQSFRFGPEIAWVAASCLEVLKGVKEKTLVGNGQPCKIMGETVGQVAVICRCNFTVFNEAVTKCCFSESNDRVGFVGGTDAFGFPMLQDIYTLMLSEDERRKANRQISHKFISKFTSIGDLENYAKKTNDTELMGKVKIVRTYHHNLPSHIQKILSKSTNNLAAADMILSTAHKAKGLEFSTVRVTDDFNVEFLMRQQLGMPYTSAQREQITDEGNLLYVAVTRAKHALQMNEGLLSVLRHNGENFQFPMLSSVLKERGVSFHCIDSDTSDREFKPYALTLEVREVKLNNAFGPTPKGVYGPTALSGAKQGFSELLGDKEGEQRSEKSNGQFVNHHKTRNHHRFHLDFDDFDILDE